jgi:hypothetical protein
MQKADYLSDKKKAYDLAMGFTDQYPFIGEGWRQRSQLAEGKNLSDSFSSAQKAAKLGLEDIGLCRAFSAGWAERGGLKKWGELALIRAKFEEKRFVEIGL